MRSRRHLVFAIVGGSQLVYAMQFTTISVAFVDVLADLHAPLRWGGWVLTMFMLGQVLSLAAAGTLTDRVGRGRMYLIGVVLFSSASLLAALAPNVYVLIAARAGQGIAGGVLIPSSVAIVSDMYGEARARPVGFISAVTPVGSIIGPILGSFVVDHFGWRWTFALNVPLGVVTLTAGLLLFPRDMPNSATKRQLDGLGLALLAVVVSTLMLGLSELSRPGREANLTLVAASFGVSAVTGVIFARRQRRTPSPIVAIDLLARPAFAAANALAFCFGAALYSISSLLPLYAREAYGLSVAQSGALLTPRAVVMVGASTLAAYLLPITGYRRLLVGGLCGFAAALAILSAGVHEASFAGIELSNFTWLAAVSVPMGISMGLVLPSLNATNLHLEPDRVPAIVGLRGMFQYLGGTIGIALAVLASSRASTPGQGLQWAFAAFGVLLVLATLLVRGIPELERRPRDPEVPAAAEDSAEASKRPVAATARARR